MSEFIKYGDTFLRKDNNGALFPVTDRETLQGLKVGQLPYNAVANNKGLSFSSGDFNPNGLTNPIGAKFDRNTGLPIGNQDSSSLPTNTPTAPNTPIDFKAQLQKALTTAISNYSGVSNASELEQKKQELLRKQLLSPVGKYAPGGDVSSLGASGALNALGNTGKEYNPAIQELQLQINTAKQGDAQSLANLTKLLSLAKTAGLFGGTSSYQSSLGKEYGDYVANEKQNGNNKPLTFNEYANLDANRKKNANDLGNTTYDPNVGGGEAFLKTISPQDAAIVKGVADYKLSLSKITSLRSSARERLTRMVMQYDPTFDMTQYATRQALRKDFTSGKVSKNIRSLNTAVKHLKSLQDSFDKLDNSSIPLWNTIRNFSIQETGGGKVTAVKNAINAVAGEMASVFKGSSGTDQEITAWKDEMGASQSPDQVKAGIQKMIELMGGRLSAFNSQWKAGIGKPKDFKILSDSSRKILSSMGVDVNKIDPTSINNTQNFQTVQMIGPDGTFEVPIDKINLFKQNGYK